MNKKRIVLLAAVALVCAFRPVLAQPSATVPAKLSDFGFDTTKLATPPASKLPSGLLKLAAFEEKTVTQAFSGKVRTTAAATKLGGSRTLVLNDLWRIERDPQNGSLLIASRTAGEREEKETGEPGTLPGASVPKTQVRENKIDEARARSLALENLAKLQIPAVEMGETASVRLMSQDLDEGSRTPGAAQLVSYKTFVFRAINGVRVQGHRAVVTHWPDGTLKRTLVHWPAIAATGNQLTTTLSVPEITARAAGILAREGVPKGSRAVLRYKYVPVPQKNGEVTLQLVVGARVAAPEKGQEREVFAEPREIEIPVDAK